MDVHDSPGKTYAHYTFGDFDTYFYFDADKNAILFSCRNLRGKGITEEKISLHEAIFAAFLWWVLVSEWCSIGLKNEGS